VGEIRGDAKIGLDEKKDEVKSNEVRTEAGKSCILTSPFFPRQNDQEKDVAGTRRGGKGHERLYNPRLGATERHSGRKRGCNRHETRRQGAAK